MEAVKRDSDEAKKMFSRVSDAIANLNFEECNEYVDHTIKKYSIKLIDKLEFEATLRIIIARAIRYSSSQPNMNISDLQELKNFIADTNDLIIN